LPFAGEFLGVTLPWKRFLENLEITALAAWQILIKETAYILSNIDSRW
jgi:hypothetical protein